MTRMNFKFVMALAGFMACLHSFCFAHQLSAHKPDDKIVIEMVTKAVTFLESDFEKSIQQNKLGSRALAAFALTKAYKYQSRYKLAKRDAKRIHPKIIKVIGDLKKFIRGADTENRSSQWRSLYLPAVATMLLCEIDAKKYQTEIQFLVQHIIKRQNEDGSWSYLGTSQGDTSQSQYAVLALWSAQQNGVQLNHEPMLKALKWFLSVQREDGSFVYHPSLGIAAQTQTPTLSMTTAGAGSIYVAEHFLTTILGRAGDTENEENFVLPVTVTFAGSTENGAEFKEPKVITRFAIPDTSKAKALGNKWLKDRFRKPPAKWMLYYMYSYERFASFRELSQRKFESEPAWYNWGIEHLKKHRNAGGTWSESGIHNCVATAFAVLFLTRSTKATLDSKREMVIGELFSPGSLRSTERITRRVESLLENIKLIESDTSFDFRNTEFVFSAKEKVKREQLRQVRSLIRHKSARIRLIAIKALGKQRDFDSVPILIYALSDPELKVKQAAHDYLRFISRKFDSISLPESPQNSDFAEVVIKWKAWYRTLYPDAKFPK